MGLNIKDIIPRKEIEISDLKGKLVFVDAFNMLYQFLSTIRQPDGTPLMAFIVATAMRYALTAAGVAVGWSAR